MRVRIVAAAAGAIVLLLALAAGLGWFDGSGPVSGAAHPFAVRTSLQPSAVFFGDPVVAEVAVDVDTTKISPSSIRLQPSFGSYVQSTLAQVRRAKAGDEETVTYRYDLQCVDDGCLPTASKPLTVQFPPFAVIATAGSQTVRQTATWPSLSVATRLPPGPAYPSRRTFRHSATIPPPEYGVGSWLEGLLAAAGALLVLGALVLAGLELRAFLVRRDAASAARRSPLQLALVYAREAAGRPDPADRRKALGLLSEALSDSGEPRLAESAGDAAWAEQPPSPDRTLELADEAQPPEAESA